MPRILGFIIICTVFAGLYLSQFLEHGSWMKISVLTASLLFGLISIAYNVVQKNIITNVTRFFGCFIIASWGLFKIGFSAESNNIIEDYFISCGIDTNYFDIINYSVFNLIKLIIEQLG